MNKNIAPGAFKDIFHIQKLHSLWKICEANHGKQWTGSETWDCFGIGFTFFVTLTTGTKKTVPVYRLETKENAAIRERTYWQKCNKSIVLLWFHPEVSKDPHHALICHILSTTSLQIYTWLLTTLMWISSLLVLPILILISTRLWYKFLA